MSPSYSVQDQCADVKEAREHDMRIRDGDVVREVQGQDGI
jgi:hypothetical protein